MAGVMRPGGVCRLQEHLNVADFHSNAQTGIVLFITRLLGTKSSSAGILHCMHLSLAVFWKFLRFSKPVSRGSNMRGMSIFSEATRQPRNPPRIKCTGLAHSNHEWWKD